MSSRLLDIMTVHKRNKNSKTFIQGELNQKQREKVAAHMKTLGFDAASGQGRFVYEGMWFYSFVVAIKDDLTEKTQLPMHSHSFMEIFQYVSDSKIEYLIGTHRYLLEKGDIVCIPPGTLHQVLHFGPKDIPCVRNLIVISEEFLEFANWNRQPNQFFLLRMSDAKRNYVASLCERCVQEYTHQGTRWREMLIGYSLILLTEIVRNSDSSIQAERDGIFENVLSYIDSNLSQRITLEETAHHFYVSERTITREFQKNLGNSFYRYVTQRRLLKARTMLLQDIPLKQVYENVGYSDYPTFYRAFRKEYGMSPRQMKQMEHIKE